MKQLLMLVPLAVLALAAAAETQSLSVAADVSAASHDALVGLCHGTDSATHPFVFMIVHAKAVPVHLAHGDVIASDPADCKLSFHYVTDSLRIGSTASEAHANAVDLNNDGFPDNALGSTLAVLSRQLGFDEQIATSLEMGEVVILHSLRADSLMKDDVASWQVFLGEPQPHPVLSGGGTFAIDPAAPASEKLIGPIKKGQFVGGPGVVALRLGLVAGQPPVEIHLVEARI